MKALFRRPRPVLILFLSLILTLSACAAGNANKKEETVVQGAIDAAYLGRYDPDYLKYTGLSEAEAKQLHQARLDAQASRFCTYWNIVNPYYDVAYEDLDAGLKADIASLYEDICSRASYQIDFSALTKNNDTGVGVSVVTIDLMQAAKDAYTTYPPLLRFIAQYSLEDVQAMPRQAYLDYSSEYGKVIVQLVRDQLGELEYGDMKTMTFIVTGKKGAYELSGDWETFDSYIISYPK